MLIANTHDIIVITLDLGLHTQSHVITMILHSHFYNMVYGVYAVKTPQM